MQMFKSKAIVKAILSQEILLLEIRRFVVCIPTLPDTIQLSISQKNTIRQAQQGGHELYEVHWEILSSKAIQTCQEVLD